MPNFGCYHTICLRPLVPSHCHWHHRLHTLMRHLRVCPLASPPCPLLRCISTSHPHACPQIALASLHHYHYHRMHTRLHHLLVCRHPSTICLYVACSHCSPTHPLAHHPLHMLHRLLSTCMSFSAILVSPSNVSLCGPLIYTSTHGYDIKAFYVITATSCFGC